MCGITGWVDYKKDLRNESEILSAMAETLAKRGLMILMFGLHYMQDSVINA